MKETELKVTIEKVNGVLVTTSNRVAEELGVNHKHLLEKIDGYIEKFTRAELSALGGNLDSTEFYIPSTYKTEGNFKTYRNYLITEKGIAQLIGGYSAAVPKAFDLNVAYINEFERMKNVIKEFAIPKTFREALLLAAEQQGKIEELEQKTAEQCAVIEEQSEVIDSQKEEIRKMFRKSEYCTKVLESDDTFPITLIAKDYGMSAQELNKKLHDFEIQYKCGNTWVLYSKYSKFGFTKSVSCDVISKDGKTYHPASTQWTQKGKIFIFIVLARRGIHPLCDKENVEIDMDKIMNLFEKMAVS